MYVLVLGLDVLGNPFGLIRGLSEGVEAFFYEPFQVQGFQINMTLDLSALKKKKSADWEFMWRLCSSLCFFQGAVQGPEEFAEGLVIGVRSLLGHTVGREKHLDFYFSMQSIHSCSHLCFTEIIMTIVNLQVALQAWCPRSQVRWVKVLLLSLWTKSTSRNGGRRWTGRLKTLAKV